LIVSKRGCAPALRVLYRLSLPSPESLAICDMPRALATWPSAATNTSGLGSSAAAERYSAMTASLSRYAARSNGFVSCLLALHVLPLWFRPFEFGSHSFRFGKASTWAGISAGSLTGPKQSQPDAGERTLNRIGGWPILPLALPHSGCPILRGFSRRVGGRLIAPWALPNLPLSSVGLALIFVFGNDGALRPRACRTELT